MTDTLLIDAREVSVSYGDHRVLHDVSVELRRGEIVTLVGLNGAGKSTLVQVLLGLIEPMHGTVYRRPGLRLGYTPQWVRRDRSMPLTLGDFVRLRRDADPARVDAQLEEVGVRGALNTMLADLSGGEMQRALLARALLTDPELLILDEPLAGVDMLSQSMLYRLIAEVRERSGCGVLLVSHELHVVMAATDRVVCLNHHVCCTGHPRAVAAHPEFVALFGEGLGEVMTLYTHHHDHAHDAHGEPLPVRGTITPEAHSQGPR